MIDSDLPALFQNHLQCIAVGVNVTENRVLSHRSFLSRPRLRLEESEACFNYDLSFIQKQDRAGNLFPAKSRRLSPFPEPVPEFRRSKAHRRCKPDSVSRRSGTAIICLCDQNPGLIAPRAAASSPIWSCCGRGLPSAPLSLRARWALTPPFHPYLQPKPEAVCFLLHWPSRGVWSAISFFSKGLPALCSPDFPRTAGCPAVRDCPRLMYLAFVNIAIPLEYTRVSGLFFEHPYYFSAGLH